jgi:FAD/FMN-containing dehydrogenase
MVDFANRLPSPHCEVAFAQLGGAAGRVDPAATAYPHRAARYTINVHTRWEAASEDAACIGWARGLFDALAPHGTGGVYVNFMPEDETGSPRVRSGAYGANYERLAKVKAQYDPKNLFRQNQNITPAS